MMRSIINIGSHVGVEIIVTAILWYVHGTTININIVIPGLSTNFHI